MPPQIPREDGHPSDSQSQVAGSIPARGLGFSFAEVRRKQSILRAQGIEQPTAPASLMPTWPSPTRRVPTGRRNLTVGCSLSIRHRAELSIGEVRAEDRFFLRRLEHGRISSRSSVDIPPWKGSCGTSRANTVRRRREDETPPGSFSSSIGRAAPAGRRSSARIRAQIRPELDLEVWDEQMLLSLLRSQFGIHLDVDRAARGHRSFEREEMKRPPQ
jgi:hypothetical protein